MKDIWVIVMTISSCAIWRLAVGTLLWPLELSSLLWEKLLGVALSSSNSVRIISSSMEDVGACL
jgi:hypothetical protein